ncbi:MAG: excinuclease ABC subunit UvrA [Luteolibacter sp.]
MDIPKHQLVVVTGPSGSGKSSLAFHTLYAEGRRRFVESLSAYARQFIEQLERPDVDSIDGLSPSIAIEQRGGTLSPRSTVATVTEIHDHLRLLWAAAGIPHDPTTGERLVKTDATEIATSLAGLAEGSKVLLLAPVPNEELEDPEFLLGNLRRQGYIRIRLDGVVMEIDEASAAWPERVAEVEVVIDRFVVRPGMASRIDDSIEVALRVCGTETRAAVLDPGTADDGGWRVISFQTAYRNPNTGYLAETFTPRHFSFNSHQGACPACEGTGVDADGGVCPACGGRRLKAESLAVKIPHRDGGALGIDAFCALSIGEARAWINGVEIETAMIKVLNRVTGEVAERLGFLAEVGLDYLTLDRTSSTLSGGEAQRIRLASQLGAGLSGVIYVLDEPSIGLHPADTARLIGTLRRLRDQGNTVVVVEHDAALIRAADHLIEIGPGAGTHGGELIYQGDPMGDTSPTTRWLAQPPPPLCDGPAPDANAPKIVVRNASEHNLRGIDVEIPLGRFVCLCGPSGSGKSTLANDILYPVLARRGEAGAHDGVEGVEQIGKFVVCDQSPIGRSPRSNPATFTGMFDLIRPLFAKLPHSKQRGFTAARFSFNANGGRCERCQGNGRLKVEMHFLPDAWVTCPACEGRRFNRETLEATYKGKSIAEVLDLTVEEARALFRPVPKIHAILEILDDLGLGYLPLGQPANTLSGGEAQRLKLAVELAKSQASHTFFLFDEPTTGLHFGDVERLLTAFHRLRDAGHTLLVIEHHLDVIAAADWVIELGPGGGENGGSLVATGTPATLARIPESPTGMALRALK